MCFWLPLPIGWLSYILWLAGRRRNRSRSVFIQSGRISRFQYYGGRRGIIFCKGLLVILDSPDALNRHLFENFVRVAQVISLFARYVTRSVLRILFPFFRLLLCFLYNSPEIYSGGERDLHRHVVRDLLEDYHITKTLSNSNNFVITSSETLGDLTGIVAIDK